MNAQTTKIHGMPAGEYLGDLLGVYAEYLNESSIKFTDYDGEVFDTQFTLEVPNSFCEDEVIQALTVNYYAGQAGGRFYQSRVFFEQPNRDGFHTVTVTVRDGYDV
jgi:ADP-ribosylglycohydrolase